MEKTNTPDAPRKFTDGQVLRFIVILCVFCALLLALLAYLLQNPQEAAKEFDRSKQMLIASKILNHQGFFQLQNQEGKWEIARFDPKTNILVPYLSQEKPKVATEDEIRQLSAARIRPLLTDASGNLFTLEEKRLSLSSYLSENKKNGYANLPLKLFYLILSNEAEVSNISAKEAVSLVGKNVMYVFPVSGFGLWAPIYGYLAIGPDGDDIIGTTWYEHAETPGLGANIAEAWWQKQFYGKKIFQPSMGDKTDFITTPIGIIVVKGLVKDVYGTSPKAQSAVDGISGATLTGNGVTMAYRDSLTPYRKFLIKIHESNQKE